MESCSTCGEEVADLPYVCTYCGETHCVEHRLPESHDCLGVEDWQAVGRVLEDGFERSTKSELKRDNELTDEQEAFIDLVDENVDADSDDSGPVWHQNAYETIEPVVMGTTPTKEEVFTDAGPDVAPDGSLVYPETGAEEVGNYQEPEVTGGMSRQLKLYTAGLLVMILAVFVYVVFLA